MKASIQAHRLRDHVLSGWHERIQGKWTYDQLCADPSWKEGWISFDAVTWDEQSQLLWCGLNSIDGDLLHAFDPKTGGFESMRTQSWCDEFDVKIHRTILGNSRDGCLYFATSMLHDVNKQSCAKGGKLVRFDPRTRAFEILAVPVPHLYVQSIAADFGRGLIYGFTFPAEGLFSHDLQTKTSRLLAWIGTPGVFAQPHNAVVDRHGWLWGTCAETRAWDEMPGRCPLRLFKYHPDSEQFVWFEHGLSRRTDRQQLIPDPPRPAGVQSALEQTRHREDYGFCDSMVYDGGEYIYAGTVAGVLCRIEVATGSVDKIAHVIAAGRFPALALRDGVLYGGGGLNGQTQLVRWDTRSGRLEMLDQLAEAERGDTPARIHEIAVGSDHTLYLGENDHHSRSSYLWSVRLG